MSGGPTPPIAAPDPPPPTDADRAAMERRVLLLAPTGRDAELTCSLLDGYGLRCAVFPTIDAMCDAVADGAGALIVPEEAIVRDGRRLIETLRGQPVWSDVTTVILSRSGSEGAALPVVVRQLGSVSIIERPVRLSTFASAINVALRARERQYQARDMLETYARLAERERAARAEAEGANRMKDEFLATLSHELRTPLSAILGWSQMLRRDNVKPETLRGGLDTIERNARAQTKIIEDLLDMSRIISGKIALEAKLTDLAEIVHAAVETVRAASVAKEIELDVGPRLTAGGLPVLADPSRLQQVFWNLLSNAIKFTPRRGRIRLRVEREQSQWQIGVADDGEGIAPDFLPFVFDRFRQADASITRKHGGLGLGLSIVRQLVELHGGRVEARSPGRGEGATFIVSLPISPLHATADPAPAVDAVAAPANGEATPAATPASVGSAGAALAADERIRFDGLRVLVVDDEPDARAMVAHLLASHGADVEHVASVAAATDRLRDRRFDLIVSDVGMPGEDGYALAGRLRSDASLAATDVPAIALTAYARAEDRVRALRAGFTTHVPKPVEPGELVTVIATLTSRGVVQPRSHEATKSPYGDRQSVG